jgi:pimeloyl-ACP methyl ester carboxylesterase
MRVIPAGWLVTHGRGVAFLVDRSPIGASAMISARLVKGAKLKVYPGLSHGLFATHHEVVNPELLAFFRE